MARKTTFVPPSEPVPPLPTPDQLKDIAWVQDFLQVSRSRVFQMIRKDGLPYIKWDRILRFHPHAVVQWAVERQQQKSA